MSVSEHGELSGSGLAPRTVAGKSDDGARYGVGARWRNRRTGREIVVLDPSAGYRSQLRVQGEGGIYYVEPSGLERKYELIEAGTLAAADR